MAHGFVTPVKLSGTSEDSQLQSDFNEIITVSNVPSFGLKFYQEPHEELEVFTGGTGTVISNQQNATLTVSSGTALNAYGLARSRRFQVYEPGRKQVVRFSALFSSPTQQNSLQRAGFANQENAIGFGYNGKRFGVVRRTGGLAQIVSLQITSPSTLAGDVLITLAGVAGFTPVPYTVALTALGSVEEDAAEIAADAQFNAGIWNAEAIGDTVYFSKRSVDAINDVPSFADVSSNAAGVITQDRAGVDNTDFWYYQQDWNGDKFDGTGPSKMVLDPQKFNLYTIAFEWFGVGNIQWSIYNPELSAFTLAHTERIANQTIVTTLLNPNMQVEFSAASLGSTTDVSVSCACFATFGEGAGNRITNPLRSHAHRASIGTTETALLILKGAQVHQNKVALIEHDIERLALAATVAGNRFGTFRIYANPTITSLPLWTSITNSSALVSDSAITWTGGTEIGSLVLAANNSEILDTTTLGYEFSRTTTILVTGQASASTIEMSVSAIFRN